jgi:hypothetical protein
VSKPWIHARSSARKYGGTPNDYLDIHEFMDSSKSAVADVRHRMVLHNSFGCYVVQMVFGIVRVNSDQKEYSPRDVAEDHIIEDLGFIPSLEKWTRNIPLEKWMGGRANIHQKMKQQAQEQYEMEKSNES